MDVILELLIKLVSLIVTMIFFVGLLFVKKYTVGWCKYENRQIVRTNSISA